MKRGTVKAWHDELGWGVVSSPDVDGEVWCHFMAIEAEPGIRFRTLTPGAPVEFRVLLVPGGQDGYAYRADWIREIK